MFSNALASIASIFSGAESSRTFIFLWDDIECPKELL